MRVTSMKGKHMHTGFYPVEGGGAGGGRKGGGMGGREGGWVGGRGEGWREGGGREGGEGGWRKLPPQKYPNLPPCKHSSFTNFPPSIPTIPIPNITAHSVLTLSV
jgi:hypothetical protein